MTVQDYRAFVLSVHDGDTVAARLSVRTVYSRQLSMTAEFTETIRLDGINAPELPTLEGQAARDWLVAQLQAATMTITLRADLSKRDKYGRLLGRLIDGTTDLNAAMITAGFAKPYAGRGPK